VNYGSYGYLPNDHRHQFKLRGMYGFGSDWRVGMTLSVQSGRPISAFGTNNPFDDESYHSFFVCTANCDSADAVYELLGRGSQGRTPWVYDLGANVSWQHSFGETDVMVKLAVYNLLTARENLEVFGALNGVNAATLKTRVDWALEWSDLKDRANEITQKYSGGMKRRLNIACSLLHDPKIVLLDEPTVGVDPQSRERIYEMLAALQQRGVAVVLTTHHLEEAEQRCERILIIDHGKIVAAGTLDELVRSTLGGTRTAHIRIDAPWPAGVAVPAGARVNDDGRAIHAELPDLGASLARLIDAIGRGGRNVTDVKLTGSTLHEVFIALTGRELRE